MFSEIKKETQKVITNRASSIIVAILFTLVGSVGTYVLGAVVFRSTASARLTTVEAKVSESQKQNEVVIDKLNNLEQYQLNNEKRVDRIEDKLDQLLLK